MDRWIITPHLFIEGPDFVVFISPASSDDTVQILPHDVSTPLPPIAHPVAVRTILPLALTDLAEPYLITGAGDIIRVFDVSSPREPELISEIDAHWHDVTILRLWMRKFVGPDNKARIEPWIVSTSLDGTIRKWRLSGMSVVHIIQAISAFLFNIRPDQIRTSEPNSSQTHHREGNCILDTKVQ